MIMTDSENRVESEELMDLEISPVQKKKRSWSKTHIFVGLCVFALLFLLLAMAAMEVAIVVLLAVDGNHSTIVTEVAPVSMKSDTQQYSKEFQLSLDETDWEDREAMMARINNDLSDLINFEKATVSESVREEWGKSLSNCGGSEFLRFRRYVAGDKDGDLEMTLKKNGDSSCKDNTMKPATISPFGWVTSSRGKCEMDIHPCSSKTSFESRIMLTHDLDTFPSISTCSDVALFWPSGLHKMKEKHLDGEVSTLTKEPKHWWVRTYKGQLAEYPGTSYEIAVTLKYSHIATALEGDSPHSGSEWSIKVLSREGGTSSEYDKDAVAAVEEMYRSIIPKYDQMKDMNDDGECE